MKADGNTSNKAGRKKNTMISIRHFFLAGVASVAVAAPASAVTFTKVADTGVAVPGSGTGNFTFFERSAVIRLSLIHI